LNKFNSFIRYLWLASFFSPIAFDPWTRSTS